MSLRDINMYVYILIFIMVFNALQYAKSKISFSTICIRRLPTFWGYHSCGALQVCEFYINFSRDGSTACVASIKHTD